MSELVLRASSELEKSIASDMAMPDPVDGEAFKIIRTYAMEGPDGWMFTELAK